MHVRSARVVVMGSNVVINTLRVVLDAVLFEVVVSFVVVVTKGTKNAVILYKCKVLNKLIISNMSEKFIAFRTYRYCLTNCKYSLAVLIFLTR